MGGPPNPALAYHEYLGPAIFVPMSRVTLAAAKPKQGDRVLDVACGSGIVTVQLPPLVGGMGKVCGLDINPAMLAVAASQPQPEGPQIEWLEGNGMDMKVESGGFDLLVCQHGLQFFPDRAAGAREFRRVLAQGGRAVVACWQSLDKQSFFATMMRSIAHHVGVPEHVAGAPFSLGSDTELQGLLTRAGFSRVEMQTHVIETRFTEPQKFIRMTAGAGAAVMPDMYKNVDLDALAAKVTADCAEGIARYSDGEYLKFPMPTNLAIAYV